LAAGAGIFCDILTVVQNSYVLATKRGAKTVFKLKNYPKYRKINAIDTKNSKVPSPKCTFLRTKCQKANLNIEKTVASATFFIQMFHIYY
jgi:hypothetical protein